MKTIGKLLTGFASLLLFESRTALAVLWAVCTTFVSAQGPAGRSCNTVDPPVSHWSADVKVGPGYSSINGFEVNFGGSAEYALNPFAGVGFQALYGIRRNALDLLGYGSLNLSNLAAPFRAGIWKRTNFFANAGGGIRQAGLNLSQVAFDLSQAGSSSLLVLAGLNSEYNLTDALALEIGGDLLYGLDKRVNVSLGLRYKFGVSDKKHAHNISMNEYRPQPSPIIIRQTNWAGYDAASLNRLEALEKSNADLEVSIQSTTDKIKAYMELLASQVASQAATKAVGKSALKPGLAVKPPVAVPPTLPSTVTLAPINAPVPDTAIVPAAAVSVTSTPGMEPVKVTPKPTAIQSVPKTPPPPQLKVANAVTGTMNPVEFLTGSTQLTSDSKLILNEMASILSTVDWKSLTIIGNTDNQGNPSDNKILSLKRATIVRSYLISKGLPFRKLKVRGDGGSSPIDSNKTPLGRRLNRRVDFTLEN